MGVAERRERERLQRRNQILDAAESLFVEQGYDSTSMDAIAAKAEVSKGTLYLYFASRGSVHAAVAERRMTYVLNLLRDQAPKAPTGFEALRVILETVASEFTTTHCQLALQGLSVDSEEQSPSIEARNRRRRDLMAVSVDALKRGQQDGTVRSELEPVVVALQLWGSFLGISLLRLKTHSSFEAHGGGDDEHIFSSFLWCTLRGVATDRADLQAVPLPQRLISTPEPQTNEDVS